MTVVDLAKERRRREGIAITLVYMLAQRNMACSPEALAYVAALFEAGRVEDMRALYVDATKDRRHEGTWAYVEPLLARDCPGWGRIVARITPAPPAKKARKRKTKTERLIDAKIGRDLRDGLTRAMRDE